MRIVLTAAAIAFASPAMAYDVARSEALKDDMAIAAVCLERFGDRDLFETIYAEFASVEAENPSPTVATEMAGFRDGVQIGAKLAGRDLISDDALTFACNELRSR